MPHAITVTAYGGPENLIYREVAVAAPGPHELRIRQRAVGVNFIDIYQRTGLYKLPELPAVLGMEGAGDVVAVGASVADFAVGDRVAYAGCPGAYAEERLVPAERMVRLPDAISYEAAAAMMLQGMTVRYLFREIYAVSDRTVMLFHAAAGGVGHIACQWAKGLGATMIGTVGSDAKAERAKALGCTHVINTGKEDFVRRTAEITAGRLCDVVYDSIGKDTYLGSLACLKPKGLWVSFGNASGPVPPFDLTLLKGSLFATRPSLFAYTAERSALLANATELFEMVQSGKIAIAVNHRYPLKDAAAAHRALEARQTTGSMILIP